MADRVVVGVDGSRSSRKALRWAARDARRRDAELRVITVHTAPYEHNPYSLSYVSATRDQVVQRLATAERRWREHQRLAGIQEAEALLDELIEDLPPDLRHEVAIEAIPREGSRPANELLEAARNADLLVVGSRGRGGFTGLLLGSVSQQLAQRARCPVVIVHETDQTIDLTDDETAAVTSNARAGRPIPGEAPREARSGASRGSRATLSRPQRRRDGSRTDVEPAHSRSRAAARTGTEFDR